MFDRLLCILYRWLHHVGEWREHNEFYIALFETVAALTGSILFFAHLPSVDSIDDLFDPEFYERLIEDTGLFECIILVILSLSLLARLALLLRRRGLGPSFWELANRRGVRRRKRDEQDGTFLDDLAKFRPARSFLGHRLGGRAQEAREIIQTLANASASTYSVRTLGEPDRWWAHWEAAYIEEWHALRPDSVWRIPSAVDPKVRRAGYFSVMIPITDRSYARFRRGHLHAAMAMLDTDRRRGAPDPARHEHVNLLAYSALYVPVGHAKEAWDRELLVYTPIEHLSAMVARSWPDLLQPEPVRGLRVICESSNASLDLILETLGFHALYPQHDDPEQEGGKPRRPRPLKSPAGFKLYELCYDPANGDGDAANARGKRFLDAVRRIAGPAAATKRRRGKPIVAPEMLT